MEQLKTDVLIIGGAVSGGSLACALARHGLRVTVVERRISPGSLNRGDGLQPKTIEILEKWGMLPNFIEQPHVCSSGINIYNGDTGLMEIDLSKVKHIKNKHIMCLPHRNIEEIFLEKAANYKNVTLLSGFSAKKLLKDSGTNIVNGALITNKEKSFEVKAKVVVGADGGHSITRKALDINGEKRIYNHELVVVHIDKPAWFSEPLRTRVYLHPNGATVLLPLPENKVRLAAVVSPGEAVKWSRLTDEQLANKISERLPRLKGVKLNREGEHVYKMIRMHAESYYANGAVLIGDAAHQTHASSGQGMNMAIQDADILADCLVKAFNSELSFEKALKKYEDIRKPINEDIIERSNFMSSVVYTPNSIKHHFKITGLYCMRVVPGLKNKIGYKIAQGISGANQPVHI